LDALTVSQEDYQIHSQNQPGNTAFTVKTNTLYKKNRKQEREENAPVL
jgi:hypothetical protein